MNDGQVKVAQMGVNAQAFATSKVSLFNHSPAMAVDTKFADTRTKLDSAITALGGRQAIQQGGGFGEGTGAKSTSWHDLEELLRDANRTAGAIAEEHSKPAIMDRFRMPHGSGDEGLKTKARAMAQGILDLGLDAEFAAHGMGPVASTTLLTAAHEFEGSQGEQGTALASQAGATAAIPGFLKQIKGAVKTFDSIFHNMFKGDPETLGAWKTASHVEKVAVKKKKVVNVSMPAGALTPAHA
jgi:hypothetical protein